uniref:Myosin N-terminal SH3-like domain-containing protein n=1 Tax=Ascaris lumbricoides TaxID=6252 RepID=A0A0M3IQA1_ASCLU
MALEYENDPGWQYLRRSREQIAADQSAPYDSKKDVWIPDKEEGYIAAQIVTTKGDEVVVRANGVEVRKKRQQSIPKIFIKSLKNFAYHLHLVDIRFL